MSDQRSRSILQDNPHRETKSPEPIYQPGSTDPYQSSPDQYSEPDTGDQYEVSSLRESVRVRLQRSDQRKLTADQFTFSY